MHALVQEGKSAAVQPELAVDTYNRQRPFADTEAQHLLGRDTCGLKNQDADALNGGAPFVVAGAGVAPPFLRLEGDSQEFPQMRTRLFGVGAKSQVPGDDWNVRI